MAILSHSAGWRFLVISPSKPLCDKHRFFRSFALNCHCPNHLNAAVNVLQVVRYEVRTQSGIHTHRSGKTQTIQTVVHTQPRRAKINRIVHEMRQQRQCQKTMRDCRPVRRVARGTFRINVYPLVIVSQSLTATSLPLCPASFSLRKSPRRIRSTLPVRNYRR